MILSRVLRLSHLSELSLESKMFQDYLLDQILTSLSWEVKEISELSQRLLLSSEKSQKKLSMTVLFSTISNREPSSCMMLLCARFGLPPSEPSIMNSSSLEWHLNQSNIPNSTNTLIRLRNTSSLRFSILTLITCVSPPSVTKDLPPKLPPNKPK